MRKIPKDYQDQLLEVRNLSPIDKVKAQIKYFEDAQNWNQKDRFIQGKISGLKHALRLIER